MTFPRGSRLCVIAFGGTRRCHDHRAALTKARGHLSRGDALWHCSAEPNRRGRMNRPDRIRARISSYIRSSCVQEGYLLLVVVDPYLRCSLQLCDGSCLPFTRAISLKTKTSDLERSLSCLLLRTARTTRRRVVTHRPALSRARSYLRVSPREAFIRASPLPLSNIGISLVSRWHASIKEVSRSRPPVDQSG